MADWKDNLEKMSTVNDLLSGVNEATEAMQKAGKKANAVRKMLTKLGPMFSLASSTFPVAGLALDLFMGDQPDPALEEIKGKIDELSAKVDKFHDL